jgi:hypothetical protein
MLRSKALALKVSTCMPTTRPGFAAFHLPASSTSVITNRIAQHQHNMTCTRVACCIQQMSQNRPFAMCSGSNAPISCCQTTHPARLLHYICLLQGSPFAILGCSDALALYKYESGKYTPTVDGANSLCPISRVFADLQPELPCPSSTANEDSKHQVRTKMNKIKMHKKMNKLKMHRSRVYFLCEQAQACLLEFFIGA